MWHNLKKDPPKKAGQYLVFIDDGEADCFASVEHYFKKGDYITTTNSDKETLEERMYDALFNKDLELHAWRNGFYTLSDTTFDATWDKTLNHNRFYEVYWRELPDPPEGKVWGQVGSSKI